MLNMSQNNPAVFSTSKELDEFMKRDFFSNKTGWQRLKCLVTDVFNGEERAEVALVQMMSACTGTIGVLYGGIFRNSKLQEDFIRKHNHRVFLGRADAKRMYYDYLTMYALRSGITYGLKCSIVGAMVGTQLMCSVVYRNDLRVTDCALGMGLVSSLTRLSMGLKAMTAAFVIGSVAGTMVGGISKGVLKLANIEVSDILVWGNHDYFYDKMKKKQEYLIQQDPEQTDFVNMKLANRPQFKF